MIRIFVKKRDTYLLRDNVRTKLHSRICDEPTDSVTLTFNLSLNIYIPT